MSDHKPFSPSAADTFMQCGASVAHSRSFPMPPSEYSEEGNLIHDICKNVVEQALGASKPVKFTCTEDQAEIASEYYNRIAGIMEKIEDEYGEKPTILIEKAVKLVVAGEEAGGTPDCAIYLDLGPLHVLDIKSGWKFVNEQDNSQLLQYGLAIIKHYKISPTEMYLHIYQPGNDYQETFRTVKVTMEEIKAYEAKLNARIRVIKKKPDQYSLGYWCQFCNKAQCPKARQEVLRVRGSVDLESKTSEQLLELLEFETQVKGVFNDAKRIVTDRALNQGLLPKGYKIVKSFGHRKWKDSADPVELAKWFYLTSEELHEPVKLKSPSQVETAVKAKFKKDKERQKLIFSKIEGCITKPENAPKVVLESKKGELYLPDTFSDKIKL